MIRKDYARRAPDTRFSDRDYVAIESMGHHTARPFLTICLERRGYLAFGVNSGLCRLLSDRDREEILATVKRILEERK
jgi:hypothetical protein